MTTLRDEIKTEIRVRFYENVNGQFPCLDGYNKQHDGAEGDWLTKAMGLTVNGRNEPDFKGFEMKKDSAKTTFGDWSPDEGLFVVVPPARKPEMDRTQFLIAFGVPRIADDGVTVKRHSWSGTVFPKVGGVNGYGQVITVDEGNNVLAEYNYDVDERRNKQALVPTRYHKGIVTLAKWSASRLKQRLEKKFNQFGWFKCLKDSSGKYCGIQFGKPVDFMTFIALVRTGDVFCDCGMYSTNFRPYMTWRASKKIWERLEE